MMKSILLAVVALIFSASIVLGISLVAHAHSQVVAPFDVQHVVCAEVANGKTFNCNAACPANEFAGSGGWNIVDEDSLNLQVVKSRPAQPLDNQWSVTARANDENEALTFTVYAVCAPGVQ